MPTTVFDVTASYIGTDDGDSNNNLNFRVVIGAANLSAATGNQLRVTVRFGASVVAASPAFDNMYIGQAAATGNPWDFTGTQVQVFFGGSATINASGASGQEVVSDWITLGEAFDNTKDYVFAFHANSAAGASVGWVVLSNSRSAWDGGGASTSANTVQNLAFGNGPGGGPIFIEKIEIQTSGGDVLMPQIWL